MLTVQSIRCIPMTSVTIYGNHQTLVTWKSSENVSLKLLSMIFDSLSTETLPKARSLGYKYW